MNRCRCYRVGFLVLFFSVMVCNANVVVHAQDPPKFSDFAEQMPKANTEVFALNNLLGHTMALLENKALERVLERGALAELGEQIDMESARDFVEDSQGYFPNVVAVSADKEVYQFFGNIFEVLLRVGIAGQSTYAEESNETELADLESELIEILDSSRIPNISVWVKWPDDELTLQMFEGLKQQVAILGLTTELAFVSKDDGFRLTGTVSDCLQEGLIEQYLLLLGFEDEEGELAAATQNMKIFLDAKVKDGAMLVTIGSDTSDEPRASIDDMIGLQNGALEIGYGKWNGAQAHLVANKMQESLDKWKETELGKFFIASDVEDAWGDSQNVVNRLLLMPDNGQLRVWRENNQVRANVREVGLPQVDSLSGSAIADWIPADMESYAVSNQRSFGSFVSGWMTYVEEQMSKELLKSQMRGEFRQTQAFEAMFESYHLHFGPLRRLIRDELGEIHSVPFAFVMDTEGTLETLNFDFGTEFIEPISMDIDRMLRMAAISKTEDTYGLETKFREAYKLFAFGALAVAGADVPDEFVLFKDLELAEGVQAQELVFDWMIEAEIADIEVEGDFRPHLFVKNDYVVFSTSIDFSQKLLAAESSVLPTVEDSDASLMNYGRIRGKTVGNFYRGVFQLYGEMAEQTIGEQAGTFAIMSDAFSELGEIMNYCDWNATQKGEVSQTLYIFDFQDK